MGSRILIVDDDPVVQNILSLFLNSLGFEPVVAADENHCLQLLSDGTADFGALFLDYQLPSMVGPDLLVKIRAGSMVSQPKVIMLSANSTDQLAKLLKTAPPTGQPDRLLEKPFTAEDVRSALSECGVEPRGVN